MFIFYLICFFTQQKQLTLQHVFWCMIPSSTQINIWLESEFRPFLWTRWSFNLFVTKSLKSETHSAECINHPMTTSTARTITCSVHRYRTGNRNQFSKECSSHTHTHTEGESERMEEKVSEIINPRCISAGRVLSLGDFHGIRSPKPGKRLNQFKWSRN